MRNLLYGKSEFNPEHGQLLGWKFFSICLDAIYLFPHRTTSYPFISATTVPACTTDDARIAYSIQKCGG